MKCYWNFRGSALWFLGFAELLAVLWSAPVHAQRVALVIGHAKYQYETPLRNPENDAKLLAKTFKQKPLSFDQVTYLSNATRADVLMHLGLFKRQSQQAQVAVIYYSGHGMMNSKRQNYILPVDMPNVSAHAGLDADVALNIYGISEDQLLEALDGAKVQIAILDACRDHGFNTKKSASKGLSRRNDQTRNRLVAYATEEGRVAEDGTGANSTYASSLAKHLVRTDWPLLKVFDEVANDVEHRTANTQQPTRTGNLRTDVYLIPSASEQNTRPSTMTSLPSGAIIGMPTLKDCPFCPELLRIPQGSFVMGSSDQEQLQAQEENPKEKIGREAPTRTIKVAAFALGKYEVSVTQWQTFTKATGYKTDAERGTGGHQGCNAMNESDGQWAWNADRNWQQPGWRIQGAQPVTCVSWNDAQAYVKWLSKETGKHYRLASEAEWEYAARAGTNSRYAWGDDEQHQQQCKYANGQDQTPWPNGDNRSWIRKALCTDTYFYVAPIGTYLPNRFGLYDMSGNVWEWVQDCFEEDYSKGQSSDAQAHRAQDDSCTRRVFRGGSWSYNPQGLRSAARQRNSPDYRSSGSGVRVARTLP